jgi:hypothetical protein
MLLKELELELELQLQLQLDEAAMATSREKRSNVRTSDTFLGRDGVR